MSTHETPHTSSNPEGISDLEHEPHGAGIYVKTLLALLILTVITVAASYVDFGSGNVVIALFIASLKAVLVALFFMHLRYDKPVIGLIASTGFFFLGIFLMFCFIDFDSRNNLRPVNWNGKMPVEVVNPAPAAGAAPAAPAEEKK
jgi:cytochrome c oxidase subunit IV